MAIERVRYFTGLFLKEPDFTGEQSYHRAMRYRHNKFLHTPGVVSGLTVTPGANKVTIAPGMAIDASGHELVLDEPLDVNVTGAQDIAIKWEELPDPNSEVDDTGVKDLKRWIEQVAVANAGDADAVVLARATAAGNPVPLDPNFRPQMSGPAVPGPLTLPSDPTLQQHAATKRYVDTLLANHQHDGMTGSSKIPAISGAHFASLDGSALTSLTPGNIAGVVPPAKIDPRAKGGLLTQLLPAPVALTGQPTALILVKPNKLPNTGKVVALFTGTIVVDSVPAGNQYDIRLILNLGAAPKFDLDVYTVVVGRREMQTFPVLLPVSVSRDFLAKDAAGGVNLGGILKVNPGGIISLAAGVLHLMYFPEIYDV